jgi:hypothetical protein
MEEDAKRKEKLRRAAKRQRLHIALMHYVRALRNNVPQRSFGVEDVVIVDPPHAARKAEASH